jgi:hypothetical protein
MTRLERPRYIDTPVESFNSDFMPAVLAPWIDDIADRLQCPPDYVAVSGVTAIGSVIGRHLGIKPQQKTDWVEVPNVWGLFIGRPGMLKSPAMMEALKPIHHLEAQAAKENQAAQGKYREAMGDFKLRKDAVIALKKKEMRKAVVDLSRIKKLAEEAAAEMDLAEPSEPIPVRFRTNDSSYESFLPISFKPSRNAARKAPVASAAYVSRYPTTGSTISCARAAIGHAAAALPSSVMNSRRPIIRSPRRSMRATCPARPSQGPLRS